MHKVITHEETKKAAIKRQLISRVEAALEPVSVVQEETTILLIPGNYQELSESELSYTLRHNPMYKQTPESVLLTIEMIFRGATFSNIELQPVEFIAKTDVSTTNSTVKEQIFYVPSNYESFNGFELYNYLRAHPRFKQSAQSAALTVGILFEGKDQPSNITIEVID